MPTTRHRRKRASNRNHPLGEVLARWNAGEPPPPRSLTLDELDWLLGVVFFGERDLGEVPYRMQPHVSTWLHHPHEAAHANHATA